MKKMNLRSVLAVALTLALTLACLTACGGQTSTTPTPDPDASNALSDLSPGTQLASGGVLRLKVNPELAITYDADGNVTNVEARNDDGSKILETYTGFEGKACKQVVAELVTAIGEAGYFIEEIEGESRQITIEIETGSMLPSETFLNDVADEVRRCVNGNDWTNPVALEGNTNYGVNDYVDTDYGPNNDGVTDYVDTDYGADSDGITDYNAAPTATSPAADTVTPSTESYDDTDYGPNNDGVTDYNAAVIGTDGTVTYVDTDYGVGSDGVTDYSDTDYGPSNDGVTDYTDAVPTTPSTDSTVSSDDTDYGPNNDGVTDYTDDGSSNYDDGGSSYDDGSSNYGSNYGSDYD